MGTLISRRTLLEGVGVAGVVGMVGTQSAGAHGRDPLNRYLVGTEPGRADVARDAAGEVHGELNFGAIGQTVSGWYPEEAVAGLRANPHVRYVEPEGLMHAVDHTIGEDDGDPTDEQVLPWGIDRVDADVAHHDAETGNGSSIAIIDTGIDPDHETLEVAGGEAFVSCRGPCTADWDDDQGHGTHCAGTAAAIDSDSGVVGVAPNVDLFAVKVLDSQGSGTFSDIAAGIEWTADQGIDIGSLSLGADSGSETVKDACEYAVAEGTLLVAAAGNSGPGEDTVGYPAAYEECVAVSATDESDEIADFSSRGKEVELAAPGVDVLSSLPDDDYDHYDGTSMACPHVAGAGAQLMEHDYENDGARTQLNETAEDIGLDETEQGNGLVDVAAALGLEDDDGETSLAVDTHEATGVDTSSATLNGELTELKGVDEATVFFEWGPSGDLSHATDEQAVDSTGTFDATVSDLESDTDYEFRAVGEGDSESDTGATLSFTTESDGDDGTTAPEIEEFTLSDSSNPQWARVDVEWAVSDGDGDLDEVTTTVDEWNSTIASGVSGSSATGTDEHRERGGHGEVTVVLSVTDTGGNETNTTGTVSLE